MLQNCEGTACIKTEGYLLKVYLLILGHVVASQDFEYQPVEKYPLLVIVI